MTLRLTAIALAVRQLLRTYRAGQRPAPAMVTNTARHWTVRHKLHTQRPAQRFAPGPLPNRAGQP